MKRSRGVLVALLCVDLAWIGAAEAREEVYGRVVGVADGDTLTVLHAGSPLKVRLQGVDAPEKGQPFGEKAKQLTSELVFGKDVRVEVDSRDKYGRALGRVLYPVTMHRYPRDRSRPHDRVTIYERLEASLLRAGLAWWFRKYSKDETLGKLEREARAARRGLWREARPTPPWVWRHPELVCRGDADCAILPSACARCAPCTPRLPRVGNVQRLEQIRQARARSNCARPVCPPCASAKHWIAGTARCNDGLCEFKPADAPVRVPVRSPESTSRRAAAGALRGNRKSKVLHAPGCRDYACPHCTAQFGTPAAAEQAGYRAHRCVAPFERCYAACRAKSLEARDPHTVERTCQAACGA